MCYFYYFRQKIRPFCQANPLLMVKTLALFEILTTTKYLSEANPVGGLICLDNSRPRGLKTLQKDQNILKKGALLKAS